MKTEPSGATILLDGRSRGTSLNGVSLDAGTYTVRAELSGYQAVSRQLTLSAGQKESVVFTLPAVPDVPAKPVMVLFNSKEPGATVYVDGREIGKTPTTQTLVPGTYSIRLVRAGNQPYVQKLTIDGGSGGRPKQIFAPF